MRATLYTSPDCGPCKTYEPRVRAVCKALGVALEVKDVMRDRPPTYLGISCTPALVVRDDAGRVAGVSMIVWDEVRLREWMRQCE